MVGHRSHSSASSSGHTQGPILEDLGVAHADGQGAGGLFDGVTLEETQLEDSPIVVRQRGENPLGLRAGVAAGRRGGEIVEVDVGIDVGDLQARPAPPVRRQHRPGRR